MISNGLSCLDLTFAHANGTTILDNIDADFASGQTALITGATGAGKSSLLHLLGGLLRPTSGEVWADGAPVSRWSAFHQDLWRRKVGVLFQHLHLLNDLSILENVLLPRVPRREPWHRMVQQAEALMDRLGLGPDFQAPAHTLSGGQRQRVALARALAAEPRFLLLDEPTSFQDDANTLRLFALCTEMAARGACVVICSHDQRLRCAANQFSQRLHLVQGRLEAQPCPGTH
ncbi:MAG: ATP-binding cassette domain-containing protein [Desulfatitalea sp.]|nr:ATP-binding cassette domain-containing protein [Desulfatitalea sp.]NNJ99059.1 ATP-binding cassette domain-containing protein [Desulfatitalea sp.]